MIGEICIRHKIKGENAFFVSKEFDPAHLCHYVAHLFSQVSISACICGWVELLKENYNSVLFLVERVQDKAADSVDHPEVIFNAGNVYKLYKNN
jgi:hypothetical protein